MNKCVDIQNKYETKNKKTKKLLRVYIKIISLQIIQFNCYKKKPPVF